MESHVQQPTVDEEASVRLEKAEGKRPVDRGTIRFRAFLIGALLIPIDNMWVFVMEKLGGGPGVTMISLFANAIFILFVLVLLNALVRRVSPRQALSQMEMLVVYTMVCIGAAFAGQDWMANLIQMIGHQFYFATPENKWAELFHQHMPSWLTISDPDVLKGFYLGTTTLYKKEFIKAWMSPVVWWSLFVVVLLYVMMCINVLVRKQWVERERLTFPIAQLPLAMTEPEGTFWKNRLLWIGFTLAAVYTLINGLHFLYPSVPLIYDNAGPNTNLRLYMVTKPWTGIDMFPVTFYPFVVGLGFLLPADLLFSCWFFYFTWKAQMVMTTANAWDAIPEFPFIKQQSAGGYFAVLAVLMWSGRGYFKQVCLRIIGLPSELDDSGEAMSYRAAAIGIIVGTVLLVIFFSTMGLPPWLGFIGCIIYWAISTAVARIRAELGPPVHDLHHCGPSQLITQSVGTENIDPKGLTALTYFWWFNRAYRQHPMAFEIEGMKMASVTRASQRKMLYAVLIAAVIGMPAAFWAFLHYGYEMGYNAKIYGGTFRGNDIFGTQLATWLTNPAPPNVHANLGLAFGFFFCLILGALRLKFFGFPFHPIGYAISGSWSMNFVWLPLLVAWVIKIVILKFGGLKMYKNALPFFLGLILGEMVCGSLWSIIGIVFDIRTYSFW